MKKIRFVSVFIVLSITGILAFSGTMAFFTDRVEVQNVVTTIPEIKVEVDESSVNEFGVVIDGAKRVRENTYTLIPGYRYVKDPVVHVSENSYECYVFVKVNNEIASIESETDSIHNQLIANKWVPIAGEEDVYYYSEVAYSGMDIPLFSYFKIDGGKVVSSKKPKEDLKENEYYLEDFQNKNINIKVYASQVLGFANQIDSWNINFAGI